jgi:hypothetical protein
MLLRPRPGFYTMRLRRGALLVAAVIFQHFPLVMPQPRAVKGRIQEIGAGSWTGVGPLAAVWRADR